VLALRDSVPGGGLLGHGRGRGRRPASMESEVRQHVGICILERHTVKAVLGLEVGAGAAESPWGWAGRKSIESQRRAVDAMPAAGRGN
jgi:hypothetical protein